MKLSYGFLCDYCGKKIEYTEKTSIVYQKYAKAHNYDKVKSFSQIASISLDLCDECTKKAHKMLERKRKFEIGKNTLREVFEKHKLLSL